jgi:hypothetical protein
MKNLYSRRYLVEKINYLLLSDVYLSILFRMLYGLIVVHFPRPSCCTAI